MHFSEMFLDRADAGRQLAQKLSHYAGRDDVIVLALPRGGVPVAFEVARRIGVPLDVFIVRKLGVPGHEELAMGAIASGGVRVVNDDVIRAALRQQGAAKIVVAVPVGAPSTCHDLAQQVDEIICAITPSSFIGVGQYYEDFSQTTDDEVRDLLARAAAGES